MKLIRLIVSLVVLFLLIWIMLIWGLPTIVANSPVFCERWKLTTGICATDALGKVQAISNWTKKTIPLSSDNFAGKTLNDAYVGLNVLENAARDKLGNDKVDLALENVDKGIKSTEVALNKQGFGSKLQDIPENAQYVLQQARTALEQLRNVFDKTQRRTEDVTSAVNNTKKALDALSSVLPSVEPK